MELAQIVKEYAILAGRPFVRLFGGLTLGGAQRSTIPTALVYGPSVAIDATAGNYQTVIVTNGTAFAIAAPTNQPASNIGQLLVLTVSNASGGAAGTGTWNAIFKITGNLPAIANGFSRAFAFQWNGTNWVSLWSSAADVPN